MIHQVLSIFDRGIATYERPFVVPHVAVGTRALVDDLRSKESRFAAHVQDYDLYLLGQFDDQTGRFILDDPKLVVRCQDLIPTVQESK